MPSDYLWMIWLSLVNSIRQLLYNKIRIPILILRRGALSGFPLASYGFNLFCLSMCNVCCMQLIHSVCKIAGRQNKMENSKKLHCFHYTHLTFDPETKGLFFYWFKTSPETHANFSVWKMVVSLGSPIQSLIILGIQLQSGNIVFASYHCRNENLTPPKA